MTNNESKLPNKPSEILRLALRDLEIVENDPHFEINMGVWLSPEGGARSRCEVCHAGAVMVNTLKASLTEFPSWGQWSVPTQCKMFFIDNVRMGHIHDAILDLRRGSIIDFKQVQELQGFFGPDWANYFNEDRIHHTGQALEVPYESRKYVSDEGKEAYKNYINFIADTFEYLGF